MGYEKHNWNDLKKEYILSDFKSVSAFLKNKGIKITGNAKKQTKSWKNEKVQKEYQKSTKILEKTTEKVIEKESEKKAQKIVDIKDLAAELAQKVSESTSELDKRIAKSVKKTKKVRYDLFVGKPAEETITEKEEFKEFSTIIDRKGLKELTSALKDITDIFNTLENKGNNSGPSLTETISQAYETRKEK